MMNRELFYKFTIHHSFTIKSRIDALMEQPLHIFEPNLSAEYRNLALSIGVFLLALLALFFLFRKKADYDKHNQQQLLQLLAGFATIISFGIAIGICYNIYMLQPIKIYSDSVSTGYGKVDFDELKAVYLHTADQRSFVSPDIEISTTKLLYFEEKRGKSYLFSPSNYDVFAIVSTLRPMMDER